jgi:hypothetical protein
MAGLNLGLWVPCSVTCVDGEGMEHESHGNVWIQTAELSRNGSIP